jgi:hypothetical protein
MGWLPDKRIKNLPGYPDDPFDVGVSDSFKAGARQVVLDVINNIIKLSPPAKKGFLLHFPAVLYYIEYSHRTYLPEENRSNPQDNHIPPGESADVKFGRLWSDYGMDQQTKYKKEQVRSMAEHESQFGRGQEDPQAVLEGNQH